MPFTNAKSAAQAAGYQVSEGGEMLPGDHQQMKDFYYFTGKKPEDFNDFLGKPMIEVVEVVQEIEAVEPVTVEEVEVASLVEAPVEEASPIATTPEVAAVVETPAEAPATTETAVEVAATETPEQE